MKLKQDEPAPHVRWTILDGAVTFKCLNCGQKQITELTALSLQAHKDALDQFGQTHKDCKYAP